MPYQIKRASLAQEALRRLHNTSRSLLWSESAEILSKYSHKLTLSGWSEQTGMTSSGNGSGTRGRRRMTWFRTSGIWYCSADTLMFVPGTAGSELKQRVQNIVTRKIAQLGMTVRVVESGGVKIKDMLVKLDLSGSVFLTCCAC